MSAITQNRALPIKREQGVEVRTLQSVEELESIRPFWEAWPGHPESRMDFYLTLVRSSSTILRPNVLALYRNGQPQTILIGRLDRDRMRRLRIGYCRIRPKVDSLFFVNGALRGNGSREDCEILVRELCISLKRGDADLAYLNFVPDDSPLYECAKALPSALSRDRVRSSQLHFRANLPSSMEEFWLRLSPKVRKNKKWEARKIAAEFSDVRLACIQAPSEVESLAQTAEKVARTSYQRGIGVGFFDTLEERTRLLEKAEQGRLCAFVLHLDDQAAAFWIGDINDEVFGSDYLGFNPEYAKYSPGTYLILKAVELFCRENPRRVKRIDFGTGAAQYKELFSDEVCRETEIYIFAPSFKGVALNLVKTLAIASNNAMRHTLERAGLLQRFKKEWRRRLATNSVTV